jgi:polyisoprenoid-binding protein YceI
VEVQTLQQIDPAARVGTLWRIDPIESTVGFSIKHLVIATVHGSFSSFSGAIEVLGDRPIAVTARIDVATIDTGILKRDEHLRSADFFDVTNHPTITYRSTSVQPVNARGRNRWLVNGDLTMHGVTRSVDLTVDRTDRSTDWDSNAVEFDATASINRKDFGMVFNLPVDGGGVVVGDDVRIAIHVKARRAPVVLR